MEFLNKTRKYFKVFFYGLGLFLLFVSNVFAQTIIIHPNTTITQPKTYSNVTLDMSGGNFIVTNNATLTLENCVILGTISPTNPTLIQVNTGTLNLMNNVGTFTVTGIAQHPTTQSLQYAIQMGHGMLNMTGNTFTMTTQFTAGLFITSASIPTTGFQIVNNKFEGFHGVLYLINSDNALVSNNNFFRNSYGNIVMVGSGSKILENTISYAGNDIIGNSMDIINSDNITINKNRLFTSTCHGIFVLNSDNLIIDSNRIHGSITYAMNILSFPELVGKNAYVNQIVGKTRAKPTISNNVSITNNHMAQNRYGITARDVNGLVVNGNVFIQRFIDNAARKFWTDNSVLLVNVTNLNWANNLYKEAFTQEIDGNNSQSLNFVTFPVTGGVVL